ncbi:MAG: F0F1 ATP synthase subunit B [Phycisphaerae bacterium]
MSRLYSLLFGTGLILANACAVCLGTPGEAAEAEPSVFGGTIWASIWTLVIFILLLIVLGKFAWKPLLSALKNREDQIRRDIDSAKAQNLEAEKLLARYQDQLAGAQAQAMEVIKKSAVEAEHVRDQILAHGQEQARHAIEQAKDQIEQAKIQALKELYSKSAKIAGDLAAKILQREVNSEDHRVLIQHGLDELTKEPRP